MRISELIEQLRELDPNAVVVIRNEEGAFQEAGAIAAGYFSPEVEDFRVEDEEEDSPPDAVLIGVG